MLEVRVTDAQTARVLPGCRVTLYANAAFTQVLNTGITGAQGNVIFSTGVATYYFSVELEGYNTVRRVQERAQVCRAAGTCRIGVAIARQLQDGEFVVEEDGCYLYTNRRGTFQMQATLEWNDRIQDLDLWARYWDCGDDAERRYGCGIGSSQAEDPGVGAVRAECRRHDFMDGLLRASEQRACTMSVGQVNNRVLVIDANGRPGLGNIFANQFTKWIAYPSRVGSNMQMRLDRRSTVGAALGGQPSVFNNLRGERFVDWPEDNFMMLDVDVTQGWGPETVTIQNPPVGTYQVVVNKFTDERTRRPPAALQPITDAAPSVRIVVGMNAIFECELPPECGPGVEQLWNVVNINIAEERYEERLGTVGGQAMFKYKVQILDEASTMVRLVQSSQATTGQTRNVNGVLIYQSATAGGRVLPQAELDVACAGRCKPAAGQDDLERCVPRLARRPRAATDGGAGVLGPGANASAMM